jgi:hypothetical protein
MQNEKIFFLKTRPQNWTLELVKIFGVVPIQIEGLEALELEMVLTNLPLISLIFAKTKNNVSPFDSNFPNGKC